MHSYVIVKILFHFGYFFAKECALECSAVKYRNFEDGICGMFIFRCNWQIRFRRFVGVTSKKQWTGECYHLVCWIKLSHSLSQDGVCAIEREEVMWKVKCELLNRLFLGFYRYKLKLLNLFIFLFFCAQFVLSPHLFLLFQLSAKSFFQTHFQSVTSLFSTPLFRCSLFETRSHFQFEYYKALVRIRRKTKKNWFHF